MRVFREIVNQSDFPFDFYESDGRPGSSLTTLEEVGIVDTERLSRWLATLERPTGLFVCNDIRGQQVLNACCGAGIAVPDDVGVIGVDDDDATCLLCDPPLSSARPDAERVGYRVSEILHQMLAGVQPEHEIGFIPPRSVSERLSTNVVAVEDQELANVCRFIRQHACDGINVYEIAGITSLSRRQLERRFRQHLGRSPHEHITAIQIDRVKQLLSETDMTLEEIASKAGYSYKESLSAVFKRETGQTPGAYRTAIRAV